MEVVLFNPEIPPNTGTVARVCAATGTRLNLIRPLGFSLENKYLKRAGLDYWPHVDLRVWPDWECFFRERANNGRLLMTTARRGNFYHRHQFRDSDYLVFGPETRGLDREMIFRGDGLLRIPILDNVRSLNLANAVSVILYEGLRQTGGLESLASYTD